MAPVFRTGTLKIPFLKKRVGSLKELLENGPGGFPAEFLELSPESAGIPVSPLTQ